jgi:hypothetical protein
MIGGSTMKKLIVISMFIVSAVAAFSSDKPEAWINTGKSRLDCREISLGIKTARIVLTNGEKMSVPVSSIQSYSVNGREFVKMPVFRNNKASGNYEFMELLKTRGELSLFRMEISQITADETNETVVSDPNGKLYFYYLYKDDKPYMELDNRSLPNVLAAYGLAFSAM